MFCLLGAVATGCSGSRSMGDEGLGPNADAGSVLDGSGDGGLVTAGSDDASDDGVRLDVGGGSGTGPGDTDASNICSVQSDGNAVGECEASAPPGSFDPVIQWSFTGPARYDSSITTPLVINLDDDNGDGQIDLCDTPEVLVLLAQNPVQDPGHLFVLDGATGEVDMELSWAPDGRDNGLQADLTPVVGDIDNDGLPEIVAGTWGGTLGATQLVAFEHDGTVKWKGDGAGRYGDNLALADLDNDGDVEIYGAGTVYDHEGKKLFNATGGSTWAANTAADLDGDGDLEIIAGGDVWHHDGLPYFTLDLGEGYPHVANLDDDPEPEVLVSTLQGFYVIEHDGVLKYGPVRPTGDSAGGNNWIRPGVVSDFDGDGKAEFGQSSARNYATYEADGSLRWSAEVEELSGIAAATAFDFLGDGSAEAMYGDEHQFYIFDDAGTIQLQIPRGSSTLTEFPVVADIDNDGSAEVVVGSQYNAPSVQVVADAEDRWIQARRIWNQHTYHVTNVDEDGGIPQFEEPSWEVFNTFRANVQIEAGKWCRPPPAG